MVFILFYFMVKNNINTFNYSYKKETIFNFSNKGTEFIYALHPKSEIILHMKRKSKSITCLYFII
jgi:hypothetical protein